MAYIDGKEVLFSAQVTTGADIEVVQETGESKSAVMSQKATTEEILKINTTYEELRKELGIAIETVSVSLGDMYNATAEFTFPSNRLPNILIEFADVEFLDEDMNFLGSAPFAQCLIYSGDYETSRTVDISAGCYIELQEGENIITFDAWQFLPSNDIGNFASVCVSAKITYQVKGGA